MKGFYLFLILMVFSLRSNGQLAEGATAPDFSVQDINGNSYSLYDMMEPNKAACLDFMATWCGPCWTFKSSGVLEQVYNNLGSETTVIMIEGDWNTNTNCLYGPSGCNNSTQGNWVAGTPYPITDLSSTNGPSVMSDYQIAFYPTLYIISPDKRAWMNKSRTYQEYVNWIQKSFKLNATASVTHSTCGDNGKVTLATTGGHSVLKYKWSNGATTKDLNNMPGGTYGVTVTDLNGYFKEFGPWTVNGPSKRVELTQSNLTHINCFGDATGKIEVESDFGTPPYRYNWSNGKNTKDIEDVIAGNYAVTVTDDNNCTTTKAFTLTQPSLLKLTTSSKMEVCSGMNGSILAKGTGGVPPYNYDIGEGIQGSPYFEGLIGGKDYYVTITDTKGCDEVSSVYVGVTIKPEASAGSDKDLECKSEFVLIDGSLSDDGPEILYEWTTTNGRIIKGADEKIAEADLPGKYYIKVRNVVNSCVAYDSMEIIDVREYPDISMVGDSVINCKISEVKLTGSSKDPQVVFFWTKKDDSLFIEKSQELKSTETGDYILHVKDTVNLCVSKDTVQVSKDLEVPVATAQTERDLSCIYSEVGLDGSASSSGPEFSYAWSTLDGNIKSGANTLYPNVDKKGTYELLVSNSRNFCFSSATTEVFEQTQLTSEFNQTIDKRLVSFQDLTNGLPVKWAWDFGDGKTSLLQNPVHDYSADGEYEVCLTTENDCGTHQLCKKILIEIASALTLVNYEQGNVSCFDGNDGYINLNVQGGVPPYTFVWSTSETSQNVKNLKAGQYEVEIADNQGTKILKSFVIKEPLQIKTQDVKITHSNAGANNGRIELELFGGILPYRYQWSNGNLDNPAINLSAGTYMCTVTDANNCEIVFGPYEVKELVAASDVDWIKKFYIQPNPGNQSRLFIELKNNLPYALSVSDIYGRSIQDYKLLKKVSDREFELGSEEIESGIYFIRLQQGSKQQMIRWIRVK
ncbi:MAG: T9SS type A sorting domain-containing protein [Saprospiraceae bacterium]|nr:T9SS type A sorting domain-containing protein [Saprospiraceae bacterium]